MNQCFLDVTIHSHRGVEAIPDTRMAIGGVQPHMAKVGSYRRDIIVIFKFGKDKVGFDPELPFFRSFLFIIGNVEVRPPNAPQ